MFANIYFMGCADQVFNSFPMIPTNMFFIITVQFILTCNFFICWLRNTSALAVNCWVINHGLEVSYNNNRLYHEHEARVLYLLTTDRQTVIYYLIIHALQLIYLDSNTQGTMKKQLYPSDSSNFLPLHWRIQQIFYCNTDVYMYFFCLLCAKTTV